MIFSYIINTICINSVDRIYILLTKFQPNGSNEESFSDFSMFNDDFIKLGSCGTQ